MEIDASENQDDKVSKSLIDPMRAKRGAFDLRFLTSGTYMQKLKQNSRLVTKS